MVLRTWHLGGGFAGSNESKAAAKLIGQCPVVQIKIGRRGVPFLLDTGSMVTRVTQAFFEQQLKPQTEDHLKACNWLQVTTGIGLDIPYLEYVQLDVEVLGKVLPYT